jgi:hypothetical protein
MHGPRAGRLDKNKRAFSAMVEEKLNERDRIVLGHFIGLLCKEHFDAGLTTGLMCRLTEQEQEPLSEDRQAKPQEAPQRRQAQVSGRAPQARSGRGASGDDGRNA